jgi:hypothetical protein
MSCGDPTWGLTHGGEATGGRVWRTSAAAAAGSFAPARRRLRRANKRAWMLRWCRREAGVARVCGEKRPEVEPAVSTDGVAMAAARVGTTACLQFGMGNKWPGQLQWILARRPRGSGGREKSGHREFSPRPPCEPRRHWHRRPTRMSCELLRFYSRSTLGRESRPSRPSRYGHDKAVAWRDDQ